MKLYLVSKLIKNVISNHVQFTRYISAPMILSYGTARPSITSLSSLRRNEFFFTFGERTTIREFRRYDLSI